MAPSTPSARPALALGGYFASAAIVGAATVVSWLAFGRQQLADVVMVFLLGVVVVSLRFGRGPALAAAVLSVFAYDFFFVPPYWSLAVTDVRHVLTFAVMFVVALVISGLTGRVKAQADDARQREVAIQTERLRNALLSSVSHDLRTPLAVITGATTALLDGGGPSDPATRRDLLETVHEEALRLNRLVRNLLDMTRVEGGGLHVHKEPHPIEELVGSALNRVDDRLGGREVSTDVPAALPLVPLDPVLIEQVLVNLLENAIKHTPEGTPLRVSVAPSADEVTVSVDDRGPGVPEPDRARIFEKFQRLERGEGGGVGLGLTICRGIVVAHGGRIWVEPRGGGGSRFRFTLPLRGEEPSRA